MGIKLVIVCLTIMIVFLLLGMLYTHKKEEQNSFCMNYAAGILVAFGLFEVLALPCIFKYQKFHTLSTIYGIVLVLLCILSLILNWKAIVGFLKSIPRKIKETPLILWLAIFLMLFEMFMYVQYTHTDDDDAFYVATATTTMQEDTMFTVNPYTGNDYKNFPMRYVMSPIPILTAFCATVFREAPTIMAHTYLPVLWVLGAFCIYYLIGSRLFERDKKRTGYFLVFALLIQMFSAYSTHPQGMVFLVRIWQGKAILASLLLPMCFWMAMKLYRNKPAKADWILCLLLMLSCCMVSSMGIILGAISIGILGLIYAVYNRNIRHLFYTMLCCIPNICCALIYLLK